jgi:hypothetical protein
MGLSFLFSHFFIFLPSRFSFCNESYFRRWEDNIRMDLKEIGINRRNWVVSAQHRDYWRALVNAALNLLVP